MYLIFKVYGDYSDAAIHYAYIKCGLFTGSLSLWQPHRVWEESSATCRFSCTNICLFLHGEHFLKLFPVFQLLCSALQASNISNECCLFPCLVHLRISLGQFIYCSNYLWTSLLKSTLREVLAPSLPSSLWEIFPYFSLETGAEQGKPVQEAGR